jgi:hypothetical protein
MQAPQIGKDAQWKSYFRTPVILWTDVAKTVPSRGVAVTNQSGVYQLYAWLVSTGTLRPLTNAPTGKMSGSISPDGRYIYFH